MGKMCRHDEPLSLTLILIYALAGLVPTKTDW